MRRDASEGNPLSPGSAYHLPAIDFFLRGDFREAFARRKLFIFRKTASACCRRFSSKPVQTKMICSNVVGIRNILLSPHMGKPMR